MNHGGSALMVLMIQPVMRRDFPHRQNSSAIASKSNQIFLKGRLSDEGLDSTLMERWLKRQWHVVESCALAIRPHYTFSRRWKMLRLINRFYRHENGATATEYAMLVVFIALAIAVGAQALGGGLSNLLTNIASTVSNVTIPTP